MKNKVYRGPSKTYRHFIVSDRELQRQDRESLDAVAGE